ncbi:TolC family protein [Neisseria leonii]|uniref:TolC family protein n=1 Tax=Neisseria leonii TaxID=2995413 RepID=UPI0030CD0939
MMKGMRIGLLAVSVWLAGCGTVAIDIGSRLPLPESFDYASAGRPADIGRWWRQWQDSELDRLIEQALAANFDVKTAQSRLNEARATAGLAQADLLPKAGLAVQSGASRARLNREGSLPVPVLPQEAEVRGNGLSGGLSVSWEPDFFGAKRSDADAALYGAAARQAEVYGAQMLAAAEMAEQYFQARALERHKQIAENQTAVLVQMLRYTEGRFRAGHVSAQEVGEARAALAAAQGRQAVLDAQYRRHLRAMAVLTGAVPQQFVLGAAARDVLADQPSAPQGQTPQGLIERRPDLIGRAAQVRVQAARLGSAKADWYPRFSLNFLGQGGRFEIGGEQVLKGWAGLLSAGISLPLFTAGRIQANVDAADARLKTALLEYDQTLLQALADVDNAAQMHASLSRQAEILQQRAAGYRRQEAGAQQLFRYGSKTLDDVLRMRLDAETAEAELVQSRLARARALVGLYKALGGGWTEQ